MENAPGVVTGSSKPAVTTQDSSSTPAHIMPTSILDYDSPDLSASSSSMMPLESYQPQLPPSDDVPSWLNVWDSTIQASLSPSIWDPTVPIIQSNGAASILGLSDSSASIAQPDDNPSTPSVWDSTIHIDPSLLARDKSKSILGSYWTTTIHCGCPSPHFQIQAQTPDLLKNKEFKILRLGPSPAAADPYMNHLRIETVCTIDALFALVAHVGITEEMLCADESLSPFFRFSPESADEMASTVQEGFKTLKPDLRPNDEQITVKHHPYIDILPFPTLRKNLITHQAEMDEDEFFHDVLTGLVCWGGAGVGKRDRENSTGYASTGTPWDVRSWEAKVWFLKKYWNFLGGEDGELVRQSEWWHNIRGDDEPNIVEVH